MHSSCWIINWCLKCHFSKKVLLNMSNNGSCSKYFSSTNCIYIFWKYHQYVYCPPRANSIDLSFDEILCSLLAYWWVKVSYVWSYAWSLSIGYRCLGMSLLLLYNWFAIRNSLRYRDGPWSNRLMDGVTLCIDFPYSLYVLPCLFKIWLDCHIRSDFLKNWTRPKIILVALR
jgi:hypothetical protein